MKKYILFDHDGVLVDTELWYYTASKEALAEVGIELGLELYLNNMKEGIASWDVARAHGIDEETIYKQREKRNRIYQRYLQTEDIEIPGVEAILDELSRNFKLAIVTTCKGPDFEVIHKNRNIVQYMDFVLVREDYDQAKPEPEPYLKALDMFNAEKHEAIIVEDSERGLRSAVAAGIDCVVVHNEFTKSHDFSTAIARIESLDQLAGLLARDK